MAKTEQFEVAQQLKNKIALIDEVTQKQYQLKIPFGHDAGADGKSISNVMKNYQTGGTPWFIFIDKLNNVIFSDFHLNPDAAIDYLKSI